MIKRIIFFSTILILSLGYPNFTYSQTTQILFLGNSYTSVNVLDQKVKELALSLGDTLEVQRYTPGGYTLGHPDGGHLYNETSLAMIAEGDWDYVVLQDQSQFPSIPYFRDNYSYPGAKELDKLIKDANPCATTVFFMTWGRKYGGQQCINDHCSADFVDFFHMQDTLKASYMHMALSTDGFVAPVGVSWGAAITDGDSINLFSGDNSHPSLAGTYLAACTFYSTFTGKSSVGSTYTAGLSSDIALFLQQKADSVVLENPEQWNIIRPNPQAGFEYNANIYDVSFTDISNFGHEYHWDFGDPQSGESNFSEEKNPSHTFSRQGSYLITQTVTDECFSEVYTDTIQIVNTMLSINTDQGVHIYPNPAKEKININLNGDFIYSTYEVRNMLNRVVISSDIPEGIESFHISLNNLMDGIYIINIISDTNLHSYIFIKK